MEETYEMGHVCTHNIKGCQDNRNNVFFVTAQDYDKDNDERRKGRTTHWKIFYLAFGFLQKIIVCNALLEIHSWAYIFYKLI